MSKRQNDSDEDQRGHEFAGMRTQRACVKIGTVSLGLVCLIGAGLIIGAQVVDMEELDRNSDRMRLALGDNGC